MIRREGGSALVVGLVLLSMVTLLGLAGATAARVEMQLAQGMPLRHIARHILGLFLGQPGGRAYRQVLSEGAHRPGASWALIEQALAATMRAPAAA